MRIDGAFDQLVARFHHLPILYLQAAAIVDLIYLLLGGILRAGNGHLALFLVLPKAHLTANLAQNRVALGLAGLKQLLNAGKTLRNIVRGRDTAGVECTHRQLRTRLADGLRGNNTDSLAHIHGPAGGKVRAIAAGADAGFVAAGQHAANLRFLKTRGGDGMRLFMGDGLVKRNQDFTRLGMKDILSGDAPDQAVLQALNHLIADGDFLHGDAAHLLAALGKAVHLAHDNLLRYVHQAAGQVTRVGGAQRGVGKRLAAAVRGEEELKHFEALAEIRADGQLHRAAGGRGHQAAHARQL